MIKPDKLLDQLTKTLRDAKADTASVCAQASRRSVYRFAHGRVHQTVDQERLSVAITVVDGKRAGTASTESLDPDALKRCLNAAQAIAAHVPKQDFAPTFPAGLSIRRTEDFDRETANHPPEACADTLSRLFRRTSRLKVELAGSWLTGRDELAVVNTHGTANFHAATVATVKLVTLRGNLSGFARGSSRRVSQLAADELLSSALKQALHRAAPVDVPIGVHEVILGPEAVAELLEWLAFIAFGAKAFQERTSFLAGRMGESLFDPQLSIHDDALDPHTLRVPFDYEGTPKRRTALIDKGKAAGIVYDSVYGARFGQPSTGHAMPPGDSDGPLPLHLTIAPGDAPTASLIASCKRGLFIPRFHYVNGLLNPREALMTGLTREGAFLIEKGKLTKPVRTLRFTQSLLEAFRHIKGISSERKLVADPSSGSGCCLAPSLHLDAFTFTGCSA